MSVASSSVGPELKKRVEAIKSLPSSPAVLQPLLQLLRMPAERVDLKRVVELVSYEKTVAAQCLRIANSPLFARARPAETIQAAVMGIGVQRIEDILLSHCMGKMIPADKWVVHPDVFWRHSLGCALVCREFAVRIDYHDTDQVYLAGLLHDLGILVNCLAYTNEFREVLAAATESGQALDELEQEILGFTHCESGAILARAWQLPSFVLETIEWHHNAEHAPEAGPVVDIVHLCDLLCRMRRLGYGYEEWYDVEIGADPAWIALAKHCPQLATMDLARFTLEMDTSVERTAELVATIFAAQ